MDSPQFLTAKIEEKFLLSKTGKQKDCEDLIHDSSGAFIAVIDGVTSKTNRRWGQETGGRVAAKIIDQAFAQMPYDYTAHQAIDFITALIKDYYDRFNYFEIAKTDPTRRISASFVAISLFKHEVWSIGDCQFVLGNQKYLNQKVVDQILSNARALCLELEILKGVTIEQLCRNDVGRKFIMPLLEAQSILQNNPIAGEYWYPVVDGFPIPTTGIVIKRIPDDVDNIILATDGYPVLMNNLSESENILQSILEKDPLLFRIYKATKGKLKENISFDDRAFLKIKIIK